MSFVVLAPLLRIEGDSPEKDGDALDLYLRGGERALLTLTSESFNIEVHGGKLRVSLSRQLNRAQLEQLVAAAQKALKAVEAEERERKLAWGDEP